MRQSYCRMLIAMDVQYAEPAVVTAAVGFLDWSDPTSTLECVLRAEVTPEPYEPGAFYEGEGRAGIPPDEQPGWLIPVELRERWTLILGRSQDELPPLLERLGTVDFFMHDSEHSYECMRFEFEAAWPRLGAGGVLVSDDVNSTAAFPEFARKVSREPLRLARGMSLLTK